MINEGAKHQAGGDYPNASDSFLRALAELLGQSSRPQMLGINLFGPERVPIQASPPFDRLPDYDEVREAFLETVEKTAARNSPFWVKERVLHDFAVVHLNLGIIHQVQEKHDSALLEYKSAIDILRSLEPVQYSDVHYGAYECCLCQVGFLLLAQGSFGDAQACFREACNTMDKAASESMVYESETETQRWTGPLYLALNGLISASSRVPNGEQSAYDGVWQNKAKVFRIQKSRQYLLSQEPRLNAGTKEVLDNWREQRSRLANLIRGTADGKDHPEPRGEIRRLSEQKEQLEKELVKRIRGFADLQASEVKTCSDLLESLPAGVIVIDFFGYSSWGHDRELHPDDARALQQALTGLPAARGAVRRTTYTREPFPLAQIAKKVALQMKASRNYVGFVLAGDHTVKMIELGPAEPIDAAVREWRNAIAGGQSSTKALTVRRRVWDPLVPHIPRGTKL